MKKLLIMLFILLFASMAFALEVGDPMPDVSKLRIQSVRIWTSPSRYVSGPYYIRKEHAGDIDFVVDAYLKCNGITGVKPFGVFLSVENILYLDSNMDGIIDEKTKDHKQKIYKSAPKCPPYESS